MSIYWLLFEIAINLFEGCLYCYFLRKRMSVRSGIPKYALMLADAAVILCVGGFYSLYIWFDIPVTDSIVWIFTTIYSLFVFKEKWYIKLLWNICMGVLMLCVVSSVSTLFLQITDATWEQMLQPSIDRLVFVLLNNTVVLIVFYFAAKLKPRQEKLSWITLLLYLLLNVCLVIGIEMLYNVSWIQSIPRRPILIAIFCMLIVSIGLLAMFELLSYKAERQAELESQLEISRMALAHQAEIKALYSEYLEYRHDMKHQLSVLEEMVRQDKRLEGENYLNELKAKMQTHRFATGCFSVDALLSVKSAYMSKNQIGFEVSVYPLNDLPIDEQSFCSILGNLLDNAIEAILRINPPIDTPKIQLAFTRIRNMFYITCINNVDQSLVDFRNSIFYSSKRDHMAGLGIPSIRRMVDHVEGYCSFSVKNQQFVAEITLPYKR